MDCGNNFTSLSELLDRKKDDTMGSRSDGRKRSKNVDGSDGKNGNEIRCRKG